MVENLSYLAFLKINEIKMKIIDVPTGKIVVKKCNKTGKFLEFLSIGDYGKEKNLKADFLGLEKEIEGVPHGEIMPLSEKWVITISSQYGCSMDCIFCDVPKVGRGINVKSEKLFEQVITALNLYPEITFGKRLNLHYARMGEPTFNFDVIKISYDLSDFFKSENSKWKFDTFHPVVSTMMPKNNKYLEMFLQDWCSYKNKKQNGEAGLQLSINTTDDEKRKISMSNNTLSLNEISKICESLPVPVGRKYTLNFALTDDEIDAIKLNNLFNPEKWICKITPMHETKACLDNNLITENGYISYKPYKEVEENLKKVGFDVIVFVPSLEEDSSKITCGNAVLASEI